MCNLINTHTHDAVGRKKNKYRGSFPATYSLLPLAMSTCGEVGADVHALIKELAIERVEHRPETRSNMSQHLAEETKVARLRRRFSFVLRQTLLFRTRHHLCGQGVMLTSTRQLRSQGPVSVHAHRTEGVTWSERRKGANRVGGGIGVGGRNGDGNGVGGGNGYVSGDSDGDGAGAGAGTKTKTGVEANEGAQEDDNGDGSGDGAERGRGREWRPVDEHAIGTGTEAGTETRAVVEVGTGTKMGTGTRTRTRSERAKERPRSARNRTRTVNAIRHFYSARVIISADRE